MIVDAFISLVGGFLASALSLVPVPSAPSYGSGPFAGFFQWVAWLNGYLPISEAAGLVVVLAGLWAAWHVWRALLWVLTKAHVLGGSDA